MKSTTVEQLASRLVNQLLKEGSDDEQDNENLTRDPWVVHYEFRDGGGGTYLVNAQSRSAANELVRNHYRHAVMKKVRWN